MKRKLAAKKPGGAVTTSGYLPDSPDRFNAFNIIPGNAITMDTVPHDVLGIADTGESRLMKSNSGLHKFTGARSVTEIPMYTIGGRIPEHLPADLSLYKMQLGGPSASDSLAVYNNSRALLDFYSKRGYVQDPVTTTPVTPAAGEKERAASRDGFTHLGAIRTDQGVVNNPQMSMYYQRVNKHQYKQRENANGILDTRAPMALYDNRIAASKVFNFRNDNPSDPLYGDLVQFQGYDPERVEPAAQRKLEGKPPAGSVPTAPAPAPAPPPVFHDTLPNGEPVYGPQNSMIGVYDGKGFYPVTDFDHYKVNQQDRDLLGNADQLKQYMLDKTKGYPVEMHRVGGGIGYLPIAQEGLSPFVWGNLSDQPTPAIPQSTPVFKPDQASGTPTQPYPVVPIQKGNKPGSWQTQKQVTWGPNVEAASGFVGALGAVANTLNRKTNAALYNNQINRSTSDSQFQTYNPTLRRGYIDENSGMTAPDHQVLTQFQNLPYQSFYGQPPIAQLGVELPNLPGPAGAQPGIDAQLNANPPTSASFGSRSPASAQAPQSQSQPASDDAYESIKTFIKKQEGFARKAAWDHKQFTNGYGTEARSADEVISRQEAERRLDQYLMPTVQKIQSKLQVPVNTGQLTALSSMAYNGGYGIVRKLINQINKGLTPDQVGDVIRKTAITVDNGARVLDDLVARRKKEAGLYTRGFKVGGQYDLNQDEIQNLMKQGYELEFM